MKKTLRWFKQLFTNRKIEAYQVHFSPDCYELHRTVNAAIERGWQPFGGIQFSTDQYTGKLLYGQAMVWYK